MMDILTQNVITGALFGVAFAYAMVVRRLDLFWKPPVESKSDAFLRKTRREGAIVSTLLFVLIGAAVGYLR